ncbi:MAG: cation:proton antiporter [Thiotrichaceae bacterium]|nr:cation:proton antiporter [Thiotrichaceae bacterium]
MEHLDSTESIVFYIFVIFAGSSVLATIALYARQALLIAYIVMGVIVGPHALGVIEDTSLVSSIADIGIIFLLFLLGLSLQPQDLVHMLRKTTVVTLISSITFALVGAGCMYSFGFNTQDSVIIGISLMFSSTIIGLKLLPTTVLHHKHAGEIIVSILLLQDLIAITALLILQGLSQENGNLGWNIFLMSLNLPLLTLFALGFASYVLFPLIRKFDKIQEYIFLMTIGWCLGMAEMGMLLGLSHELGAFLGGVAMASSPMTRFIAESLKPLRDFFLIMFFFTLGARLDLAVLYTVIVPAFVLASLMLLLKPFLFRLLLVNLGEKSPLSLEMGVRLGQISEFALLIAMVAFSTALITEKASYVIQAATIISFMASSYYIVMYYPTPIATSDKLRRD